MKKPKIMLLGAYGMLGTSLSKFLIKKETNSIYTLTYKIFNGLRELIISEKRESNLSELKLSRNLMTKSFAKLKLLNESPKLIIEVLIYTISLLIIIFLFFQSDL